MTLGKLRPERVLAVHCVIVGAELNFLEFIIRPKIECHLVLNTIGD